MDLITAVGVKGTLNIFTIDPQEKQDKKSQKKL